MGVLCVVPCLFLRYRTCFCWSMSSNIAYFNYTQEHASSFHSISVPHDYTNPPPSSQTTPASPPNLKIPTVLSELAIRQRLRKYPIVQQLEHVPVSCSTLGLEVPKYPALCFALKSIQLHFNIASDAVFPFW